MILSAKCWRKRSSKMKTKKYPLDGLTGGNSVDFRHTQNNGKIYSRQQADEMGAKAFYMSKRE